MYTKLTIDKTDLPSPTKIIPKYEQLWSAKTGRSVKSGKMMGSVTAEKRTIEVEWAMVTASEFALIKSALETGYFGPVEYQTSEGETIEEFEEAYHGPISYIDRGYIGSERWCQDVKTTIIER